MVNNHFMIIMFVTMPAKKREWVCFAHISVIRYDDMGHWVLVVVQ